MSNHGVCATEVRHLERLGRGQVRRRRRTAHLPHFSQDRAGAAGVGPQLAGVKSVSGDAGIGVMSRTHLVG